MAEREMKYLDTRRGVESKGTRSANLMGYLIRNLTYKQLYDEPFSKVDAGDALVILDKLIQNARELPEDLWVDAEGEEAPIQEAFLHQDAARLGAFVKIQTILTNYGTTQPTIKLGDLFHKTIPTTGNLTAYDVACHAIVNALDGVYNYDGRNYTHFCVPFVGIQKDRADHVLESHMEDFLFFFGKRNIAYFFKSHGTSAERRAIQRAKDVGILREIRTSTVASVGSGNGMICSNNVCKPSSNPNHFCSMIAEPGGDMHCSLYSDQE